MSEHAPEARHADAPRDHLHVQRSALQVGAVDDPHEHEAEETADAVMAVLRGGADPAAGLDLSPGATRIRRSATAARPSGPVGAAGGDLHDGDDRAIRGQLGGGRPLPPAQRAPLEAAFGSDFGRVRIHTGGQTDALAQRMSARAFTVGSDIFIRSQDHRPGTPEGTRLLAHELTHTLQQDGGHVARQLVQRQALDVDSMMGMLEQTKGLKELFSDDASQGGRRGVSVAEQARRMMSDYENMFEASAPDDVAVNAMKLAAAARVIGAMVARSLNNPWLAPELSQKMLDFYHPVLRRRMKDAGVDQKADRSRTMKLATVLVSADPVMLFMTQKISVDDAATKIRAMAAEAGCTATEMKTYLVQQFQLDLGAFTEAEIATGTIQPTGNNDVSGEAELIGELSSAQFTSFVGTEVAASGRRWATVNGAGTALDLKAPAAAMLVALGQAVAAPAAGPLPAPVVGPGAAALTGRLKSELGSVEAADAAVGRGGVETEILTGLMAEFGVAKAGAARLMGEFLKAFATFPMSTTFHAKHMFGAVAGDEVLYENAMKRELQQVELRTLFPTHKAGTEAAGSVEKLGRDGPTGMAAHRHNPNYVRWRYEKDIKPPGYGGLSIAETFEFGAVTPGFAKTAAMDLVTGAGDNQYGDSHVVYQDQVKDRALYQFTAKGQLRRDPVMLLHDIVVSAPRAAAAANATAAIAKLAWEGAPSGTDLEKADRKAKLDDFVAKKKTAEAGDNKALQGSNVVKSIFSAIASNKVAFLDQQQIEVRILGKVDFATDAKELHIAPTATANEIANARRFAKDNGIKFALVSFKAAQLRANMSADGAVPSVELNREVAAFLAKGSDRKAQSFDALAQIALGVRSVAAADHILWQTLVTDVGALYNALGKTRTPARTLLWGQVQNYVPAVAP